VQGIASVGYGSRFRIPNLARACPGSDPKLRAGRPANGRLGLSSTSNKAPGMTRGALFESAEPATLKAPDQQSPAGPSVARLSALAQRASSDPDHSLARFLRLIMAHHPETIPIPSGRESPGCSTHHLPAGARWRLGLPLRSDCGLWQPRNVLRKMRTDDVRVNDLAQDSVTIHMPIRWVCDVAKASRGGWGAFAANGNGNSMAGQFSAASLVTAIEQRSRSMRFGKSRPMPAPGQHVRAVPSRVSRTDDRGQNTERC
jgi:hypothetical protein